MSDHDDRPIGVSNTCVQKEQKSIRWIWEGVIAEEAAESTDASCRECAMSLLAK
jgi:hypothetical protein